MKNKFFKFVKNAQMTCVFIIMFILFPFMLDGSSIVTEHFDYDNANFWWSGTFSRPTLKIASLLSNQKIILTENANKSQYWVVQETYIKGKTYWTVLYKFNTTGNGEYFEQIKQ